MLRVAPSWLRRRRAPAPSSAGPCLGTSSWPTLNMTEACTSVRSAAITVRTCPASARTTCPWESSTTSDAPTACMMPSGEGMASKATAMMMRASGPQGGGFSLSTTLTRPSWRASRALLTSATRTSSE